MDQSLENTLSEVLQPTPNASPEVEANSGKHTDTDGQADATMFFHNVTVEPAKQSTGKPSALHRIYEAKKSREEKQPDKYKHKRDCYLDKPNNDRGFWKPGSSESLTTSNGGAGKAGEYAIFIIFII